MFSESLPTSTLPKLGKEMQLTLEFVGAPAADEHTKKYWWKFVTEGLEIGKAVESIIGDHMKRRGSHRSTSSAGSEPISFTTGVHKV